MLVRMTEAPAHRPWLALQAMLAVQVLASLVMSTAAVLAPAVAPALGLAPERVGLFVAVAYLCAMTSGLRTGHWVARIGGVRVSQCALLALASGALTATVDAVRAVRGQAEMEDDLSIVEVAL